MSALKYPLNSLVSLGDYLREQVAMITAEASHSAGDPEFIAMMDRAEIANPWFTREQLLYAFGSWASLLTEEKLNAWLAPYAIGENKPEDQKSIALVLAGNIPLVGFHDLLCVLCSGHRALVRCASNDQVLLPFLADKLISWDPEFASTIEFVSGTLEGQDAVIATGSNNTSRYFDYYFGKQPNIIRKNRNSLAVLEGAESSADLQGVAEDIFRYFGMGCRSVSKIYVPEGYDFDSLFEAFYRFKDYINHPKYANNYDYNKAVYLMSGSKMLDNGFLLLKEDPGMGSPIGTLFYETYSDRDALTNRLEGEADSIQCVINGASTSNAIPFGQSQLPGLSDYADGVDTLKFLLDLRLN
ncbi:Acyl-CoA reductase (LuxC) [Robiginitalea myxolifaciens]|uniref:Acyl-CoA reductase (LuxC) n=1 Tax=Robiginitalea myxolifaciens TaxID=400055 RepID=A0A1I6GVQ0_9FLAO|nr:acyl-CoA reductase [Robiginitalea myxolifaciens]SFR46324.1 Acyl-CoA reductase (LuxC) [Robiginitalea myxolifaciens]